MSSFWISRDWAARAAKTSGAVWLAAALAFAASVVAARRLGVGSYGEVVLALSIAAFVAAFLDVSLEEGVLYLATRTIQEGNQSRLWSLLRVALFVDLGVGVVVWLILVTCASGLASVMGNATSARLIVIASLTVLVSTINGTTGAILLLTKRSQTYAYVQTFAGAVLLISIVIAPTTSTATLWAYVVSAAAGAALMLALALRAGVRAWGRPRFSEPGEGVLRELVRFGIHSSVTSTVSSATDSLVPVVVGSMQGSPAAAAFAVARLPMSVASLVTSPIRAAFLPEQARLVVQDDASTLRRSVIAYFKVAGSLAVVGVLVGWGLMPALIRLLYGESFDAAVLPARILLVAAGVFVAFGWTKILPVAMGRPELRTRTLAVVSVLIVVGTLALGGSPVAAASAISAAYIVYAGVWVWLLERLLPNRKVAR